jgi:hypothetical protein
MGNHVWRRIGLGIAAVALLCSCASIKTPGIPTHPWVGSKPCEGKKCDQASAIEALAKAQTYCIELREYFERGGQVTGSQRLFVGILGSLAGTVFAVTAAGTAAKAWAGLSGATNGIQTQIDQASSKPGGPEVIELIAREQLASSARVREILSTEAINWDRIGAEAALLPNQCSAQAGLGLAKAANAVAAATLAASAADRAASAANAAASAAAVAASAVSPSPAASGSLPKK